MRYHQPTYSRGPLPAVSSYTQPPVYAHALALADRAGLRPDAGLLAAAERGLEALWSERQTSSGLLAIYHPWESGTDDSPRFDSWIGSSSYDRSRWRASDQELVRTTVFGAYGEAVGNEEFAVAPASFNAIAAHAAASLGQLLGRRRWTGRATQLAEALDARWDDGEGLWSDLPLTGGGASCAFPTLDGVLPALCSNDKVKCASALEQLIDQNRFGAPYGPAYVARTHPVYDPDEYWRGASWPQLNYLLIVAARRCGRNDIADQLAAALRRGCASSEFAEYWNPESGEGRGARPQTWAAVVAAV
jgi:hypothetical protein